MSSLDVICMVAGAFMFGAGVGALALAWRIERRRSVIIAPPAPTSVYGVDEWKVLLKRFRDSLRRNELEILDLRTLHDVRGRPIR
jgi:hypothetical protein